MVKSLSFNMTFVKERKKEISFGSFNKKTNLWDIKVHKVEETPIYQCATALST